MPVILVTGATGFVGSSLAASLLAHGASVLALSRNDPEGTRTEAAIQNAAEGFGLDIAEAMHRNLEVLHVDAGNVEGSLVDPQALRNVAAVWHCAAEMSYSGHKLAQAFRTNVTLTAELYRLIAALAPHCRRFYYVSTAYVAGLPGGVVEESLNVGGRCINTYQVTKWCAEQALHTLYVNGRLPVTLFRPTIVVGHERTGWTHRNGFGLYMFVDALDALRRAGYERVTLDLQAGPRPDLIPVNRLIADAVRLTLRLDVGTDFEIFHCAGGCRLTTREIVSEIGRACEVTVMYGPPETLLDQKIDRAVDPNRPFANTEWDFRRTRLDAALATSAVRSTPVDAPLVYRLARWYVSGNTAPVTELQPELVR